MFAVAVVGVCSPAARSDAPVVYGYPYAGLCPVAGIADAVDRWKMDECNCTSFVAWALAANGQRTDWFVPGSMDAWNWANVARRAGLRVGPAPRVGAVAVWKDVRPLGHVAYVTAVHANGRFDVAEYNAPRGVRFAFDQRAGLEAGNNVQFIYVPARRACTRSDSRFHHLGRAGCRGARTVGFSRRSNRQTA